MTQAVSGTLLSKPDLAKLRESVQVIVDEKGLVKTGLAAGLTYVSIRSFLQGGTMYAKSLAKLARFAKEPAIAKTIETYLSTGAAAAEKLAEKKKKAKKSAKTSGKKKPKVEKMTAKTKKSPRLVKKGGGKNPTKKEKTAVRRSAAKVVAAPPPSEVLVGHDLDELEEEEGITTEAEELELVGE